MSLSLKGFIIDHSLVNNTPGATARFGELSINARTYSKDVQSLTATAYPKMELSVFSHRSTTNSTQLAVNHVYADLLLEFSSWLFESGRAFTASTTQVDVVAAISNRFADYVTNITADKLAGANGVYLPTRIKMTLAMNGMDTVEVVLWTANAEFEAGYDEDDIVVVPPIDVMDTFMGSYAAVVEQLAIVNPVRDMQRIETAKDKKPPTHVTATNISWVDPTQPTRKLSTVWYTLHYGSRGNTSDRINEELRRFILSKSSAPENNWRIIMPDLFRVTRFLIAPLWTLNAIQGRTALPSIYSPIVSHADVTPIITSITSSANLVTSSYETLHHPFRSLAMAIFAGTDNREDALTLRAAIPDYIGVESTHEDFYRQALSTQNFSNLLGSLIRAAESYTVGTSQAVGVRVVQYDGYNCLAAKHDNIEFVIRTRSQG